MDSTLSEDTIVQNAYSIGWNFPAHYSTSAQFILKIAADQLLFLRLG
jgi:hypothetical protein